jgi:hypothetical protein
MGGDLTAWRQTEVREAQRAEARKKATEAKKAKEATKKKDVGASGKTTAPKVSKQSAKGSKGGR